MATGHHWGTVFVSGFIITSAAAPAVPIHFAPGLCILFLEHISMLLNYLALFEFEGNVCWTQDDVQEDAASEDIAFCGGGDSMLSSGSGNGGSSSLISGSGNGGSTSSSSVSGSGKGASSLVVKGNTGDKDKNNISSSASGDRTGKGGIGGNNDKNSGKSKSGNK